VPFYRQTIALLLADSSVGDAAAPDAVDTVQQASGDQECMTLQPAGFEVLPEELQLHLSALEEDLSSANASTIQTLLLDLQDQCKSPYAPVLGLLAKTYLYQGELESALALYQQALALEPLDPKLILNTAAASLALGDRTTALKLLRPLARRRHTLNDARVVCSLLSNLALAELEVGQVAEAAHLRAELAGRSPDTVPLQDWLEDARRWAEMGNRHDAKGLLVALRAVHPRHRGVLELLAQILEELGEFRDAALVYRDLLRPGLAGL